jgi:hypothetical protein
MMILIQHPNNIIMRSNWMIVFGFVRAILSRGPTHTEDPFIVEIYSPKAEPGTRTKRFSLGNLQDNRELVLVSVLRDALVHSFPVELGCDDAGRIDHVEVRASTDYEEWEVGSLTGEIKTISIDESGIGMNNFDNPDLATVVISSEPPVKLFLNLQRAERLTKMAQLSLLQQAFENKWTLTIRYYNQPVEGLEPVKVIIGVQIGQGTPQITDIPHRVVRGSGQP